MILQDNRGVEVIVDRTNGNEGRINSVKIYHYGKLKQNTVIRQGCGIVNFEKNNHENSQTGSTR